MEIANNANTDNSIEIVYREGQDNNMLQTKWISKTTLTAIIYVGKGMKE